MGASQEYRDDHCHLSHLHRSSSESMLGNVNFANQDDVPQSCQAVTSRHSNCKRAAMHWSAETAVGNGGQ